MLINAFSFPFKTIHKDTEIVDSQGDLVLIAADDSVDMTAICQALNNQADLERNKLKRDTFGIQYQSN